MTNTARVRHCMRGTVAQLSGWQLTRWVHWWLVHSPHSLPAVWITQARYPIQGLQTPAACAGDRGFHQGAKGTVQSARREQYVEAGRMGAQTAHTVCVASWKQRTASSASKSWCTRCCPRTTPQSRGWSEQSDEAKKSSASAKQNSTPCWTTGLHR